MTTPAEHPPRLPTGPQSVSGSTVHGAVIQIGSAHDVNIGARPPAPVAWPVRVGQVPPLASAFQPRPGLRRQVEDAQGAAGGGPSNGVILTQTSTGASAQVLSGGGGVGKSQLAAAYAHEALDGGTDLVVWADASTAGGLVTAYAEAATRVQAPGASGGPDDTEADARAFLDWLSTAHESWLVVLDDVTDPDTVVDWWPTSHTRTGWVLATTRLHDDPVLSGGCRRVVDVDVYEEDEATAYLQQRLAHAGKAHLFDQAATRLAEVLGYLPLALSHAAAYMIAQRVTCAGYLDLCTASTDRLDYLMPKDSDGHTQSITVTLLLALDAANAAEPAGLARPAIELAAVLDPAGHPETIWATDAVCTHLTTRRQTEGSSEPVTPRQARAALLLLDRYGLVTVNEQTGHRAVRVHALTARAARETAPSDRAADTVRAAADAVLALWPEQHHDQPDLTDVLRANTTTLAAHSAHTTDALWTSEGGHTLLWRAGLSLHAAGLHGPGIAHWEDTAATALRILGPEHPDTLTARANLASSYRQAGRTADAITIEEEVAADRVRILGAEHPDTRAAVEVLQQWASSPGQAPTRPRATERSGSVRQVLRRVFGANNRNRPD